MNMPAAPDSSDKPAWVQLYEAQRKPTRVAVRHPGRPPAVVPRHKIGVTLSQGEVSELALWQERFEVLLQRRVSIGETVGILTRICSARYAAFPSQPVFLTLSGLVERMVA